MFHGSLPALITPFRNGILDEQAFQTFVEWQIAEGSHGLVPCGTTGEGLPCSVQLVGQRNQTDALLRVALACEASILGARRSDA